MENEVIVYEPKIYEPNEIPTEVLKLVTAEQAVKYGIIPQGHDEDGNIVLLTNVGQTLKKEKSLSRELQMPCVLDYDGGDKVRSALKKYYGYDGTRQGDIFAGYRSAI